MNPVEGTTIAERYRVIERLGEGAIGAVYRVEHVHIAKEMAMKLLREEVSAIPEVVERFEREAQSAARLDDARIVRVTDFGKHQGSFYLVMELVDGESMSDRVKAGVTVDEAIQLIDELLLALEHAHGEGVIHRDLKPDNVMLVQKDGRTMVKVLDFGLAKITETNDAPLTRAGMVFGTPRYMSPEQASAEPTDHRADIYSVGIMLFEMLAKEPPFTGASAVDVLRAHIAKDPPPLPPLGVSNERQAALESVVKRALAKHPQERFETAAAFRAALAKTSQPAPMATVVERSRPIEVVPTNRRHPLIAIAVAVTVLLIVLTMVGGGGPETVEAALDRGDLAGARAAAEQLVAEHPNDPTTYLALGHVALAAKDSDAAQKAFEKALELDRDIASEIRFSTEILRLAKEGEPPSEEVIRAVAKNGGLGSVLFLAQAFEVSKAASARRRAYAGLERLEATSDARDGLDTLIEDMKATPSNACTIRRWYLRRIVRFDDAKVREALMFEAGRGGGPFNRSNECMKDELKAHLEQTAEEE